MKEVIVGRIICFSVVLLFVTFPFVSSRLGSCEKDDDCPDFADCKFSFCVCESSYIKIDNFCFRLGNHGDDCFFHEQCNELTMRCGHENQTQWKTCICDKFHEWSESTGACMPHSKMFDYLAERLERKEKMERDIQRIFAGAQIAALFVFSCGLICTLSTIIYCCYTQKKDNQLQKLVKEYEKIKDKKLKTELAKNPTSENDGRQERKYDPNDDMSTPAMIEVLEEFEFC